MDLLPGLDKPTLSHPFSAFNSFPGYLGKQFFADQGILFGIFVVAPAAASLDESRFGIKGASRPIGFTNFQKDRLRAAAAGEVEQFLYQPRAQTAALRGAGDHDVLNFPFRSQVSTDDETLDGVLADHQDGAPGFGEEPAVLGFAPVRGAGGAAFQRQQRRNVGGSGGAYPKTSFTFQVSRFAFRPKAKS